MYIIPAMYIPQGSSHACRNLRLMQFINTFTAARTPRNVRVQREGDGSSMTVTWDLLSPVEARGVLNF